jgi:hypothetical protein
MELSSINKVSLVKLSCSNTVWIRNERLELIELSSINIVLNIFEIFFQALPVLMRRSSHQNNPISF